MDLLSNNDAEFSEIECFDAFMEVVCKHSVKSTPSEIEAYINDCKAFFRGVYNIGMIDGFNIANDANNTLKQI